MIPILPPRPPVGAALVIFAKDQPQYTPLPAAVSADGVVTTEWELTAEELAAVLAGGRVRLEVITFGRALQPMRLSVTTEEERLCP